MSKKHNSLKKKIISINCVVSCIIGCNVNCLAEEPPRKVMPNMPIYQQYVQESINAERRMPSQMKALMEKIVHEQALMEIRLQEQALDAHLNIGAPFISVKLETLAAYQKNGTPANSMANVTSTAANFANIF